MKEQVEQRSEQSFMPSMNQYSEGALKLRLDPERLIKRIEYYLKGERLVIKNNELQSINIGERLVNQRGLQRIIQTINHVINKDMVLGNLEADEINRIVHDVKMDLAEDLSQFADEWEVRRGDRKAIVHNIERMTKIFLSRTKNNGERDSLGVRTVHDSRQSSREFKKGFNPFRSEG